jgi:hypothetical protein
LAATVATATIATTASSRLLFAHALHHFAACSLASCGHDVTCWWLANAAPQHLTTHSDGLSLFARVWAKAFNEFDLNALVDKALNVLHKAFFVHTDQAHSLATQTPKLIGLRLAQGNHQRQTDAPVP